ncbi:MAG: glycosyltransferase, partial [Candidatus Shapirobacteria bacterium]|nr:glycosyltransferase [Candidatus Shapirobacteria bacterium]
MIKQVRKRDEMKPLVAVLILGYNAKKNIDDCFPNLLTQDYENYKVWFADNNSRDGAVEYIEEKYPKVRVLKFKENFGYAGGNNRLMRRAFGKGVDFCLILNSDIKVNKD